MRRLARMILAATLVFAAGGVAARYSYTYGAGARSCADFIGATKSGRPDVELAYTAWFAGYQTAMSEASAVPFMDENEAKKWLVGYCTKHRGAQFSAAAKAWTRHRIDSAAN